MAMASFHTENAPGPSVGWAKPTGPAGACHRAGQSRTRWAGPMTGSACPPYKKSIRQREHPQHRAAVRVLYLGGERRERLGVARSAADRDCDILLAVDAIGDRERVDHVVEAHLPFHFAGGVVEGAEVAIPGAVEDETAAGRQHGRRYRRALTGRPHLRAVGELDRVDASDLAIAVGHRHASEDRASAARIGLAGIERR